MWKLAGKHAPDHGASAAAPLIVDLDATLVGSHSEKEEAAPTYKRGFGFHPLWSFVDHGAEGTGEPLSYSVGFPLPHNTTHLLELIPADVWTPAYDAHDEIRDGAWVAGNCGPWPSPVDVHPTAPTTTARPPATWNRRPPETTLGPPSHPNDRINTSRRPTAATTLNTRGMQDRG